MMCNDLDFDPYLKGQGHTNTYGLLFHRCYKSMTHFPPVFRKNNLDIDLTYSTYNLNNLNKYPSITCSYIQEYLGYQSNNLYFLFSHSWPVLVYNSGQVERTSQVERKTKCSKKNNSWGYSHPLDCLVDTNLKDLTFFNNYNWPGCSSK